MSIHVYSVVWRDEHRGTYACTVVLEVGDELYSAGRYDNLFELEEDEED